MILGQSFVRVIYHSELVEIIGERAENKTEVGKLATRNHGEISRLLFVKIIYKKVIIFKVQSKKCL